MSESDGDSLSLGAVGCSGTRRSPAFPIPPLPAREGSTQQKLRPPPVSPVLPARVDLGGQERSLEHSVGPGSSQPLYDVSSVGARTPWCSRSSRAQGSLHMEVLAPRVALSSGQSRFPYTGFWVFKL